MVVGVSVGVCTCTWCCVWFVVDVCWLLCLQETTCFVQTVSICSCTNLVYMYKPVFVYLLLLFFSSAVCLYMFNDYWW